MAAGQPSNADLHLLAYSRNLEMDLGLQNKVVFVAGSSRGIGRAIVAELLAEGANVVLTGRDQDRLNKAFVEMENPNNRDRLLAICGDLLDRLFIEKAFAHTVERFGTIDHLVANIGSGKGQQGWNQPDDEWQRLFAVNFFGSARLTQTALPYLLANPEGGSILHIASIAGVEASAAPLTYSAAKAALLNYSKNLSRELAPHRIRVNAIAPGNILFEGGSWHDRMAKTPEQVQRMLAIDVPQKRFGAPRDIGALAAFLCSPASGFTTGACYVVDGGQTRSI
jgi:3-oxoacyl-[acyl-carrier protein] reductase